MECKTTSAGGDVPSPARRPAKPKGEKHAKLNPRQARFVVEYRKDWNGTRAAIRASYATSSAAVQACRLLKTDKVLDKVRADQNRVFNRTQASVDRIVRELAAAAFFNPARLFDGRGNLLPLNEMPEDVRPAVLS